MGTFMKMYTEPEEKVSETAHLYHRPAGLGGNWTTAAGAEA